MSEILQKALEPLVKATEEVAPAAADIVRPPLANPGPSSPPLSKRLVTLEAPVAPVLTTGFTNPVIDEMNARLAQHTQDLQDAIRAETDAGNMDRLGQAYASARAGLASAMQVPGQPAPGGAQAAPPPDPFQAVEAAVSQLRAARSTAGADQGRIAKILGFSHEPFAFEFPASPLTKPVLDLIPWARGVSDEAAKLGLPLEELVAKMPPAPPNADPLTAASVATLRIKMLADEVQKKNSSAPVGAPKYLTDVPDELRGTTPVSMPEVRPFRLPPPEALSVQDAPLPQQQKTPEGAVQLQNILANLTGWRGVPDAAVVHFDNSRALQDTDPAELTVDIDDEGRLMAHVPSPTGMLDSVPIELVGGDLARAGIPREFAPVVQPGRHSPVALAYDPETHTLTVDRELSTARSWLQDLYNQPEVDFSGDPAANPVAAINLGLQLTTPTQSFIDVLDKHLSEMQGRAGRLYQEAKAEVGPLALPWELDRAHSRLLREHYLVSAGLEAVKALSLSKQIKQEGPSIYELYEPEITPPPLILTNSNKHFRSRIQNERFASPWNRLASHPEDEPKVRHIETAERLAHPDPLDWKKNPDAARRRLIQTFSKEIDKQLEIDPTAVEWYRGQYQTMDQILATKIFPGADAQTLALFRVPLAITSVGQTVATNFELARYAMEGFLRDGRFPTRGPLGTWPGPKGHVIGMLLARANWLLHEHLGGDVMRLFEFLVSETPLGPSTSKNPAELRGLANLLKDATGVGTTIDGKRTNVTNGARIFGPKVGAFLLNGLGYEQLVTIDSWLARSANRALGRFPTQGAVGDPMERELSDSVPSGLRTMIREAVTIAANKQGISPAAAQALLWYYEKELWAYAGSTREKQEGFGDVALRSANLSDEEIAEFLAAPVLRDTGGYLPGAGDATVPGSGRVHGGSEFLRALGSGYASRVAALGVGAPQFSAREPHPAASSALGVHYSSRPGIKELDPTLAGTGAGGSQVRRFGIGRHGLQGGLAARSYLYEQQGHELPKAEKMVDTSHAYSVQLNNLYDLRKDPLGFLQDPSVSINQDRLEETISSAGFDGFISAPAPGMESPYIVVFNLGGAKIPVSPAGSFDPSVEVAYPHGDAQMDALLGTAYEQMVHNPSDPEVAAAYAAFKEETVAQLAVLTNAGFRFEFATPETAYKSAQEMIADVIGNRRILVYPTLPAEGYGGFGVTGMHLDHPMLEQLPNGMTYNDVFRGVHDIFGHAKEGFDFSHNGEIGAWITHSKMYSPLAQRALATETVGQEAWLVARPGQLAEDGGYLRPPDSESLEGLPSKDFAEQKAGLLPDALVARARERYSTSPIAMLKEAAFRIAPLDLVRHDRFSRWFEGSQVVDENTQRPMMVFHDTQVAWLPVGQSIVRNPDTVPWDEFNTYNHLSMGAHFSPTPHLSGVFSTVEDYQLRSEWPAPPARSYPVYLSIKNPLRLRDPGNWSWSDVFPQLEKEFGWERVQELRMKFLAEEQQILSTRGAPTREQQRILDKPMAQKVIQALGYDGVVYLNRGEVVDEQGQSVKLFERLTKYAATLGAQPQSLYSQYHNDQLTDEQFKLIAPEARDCWIAFEPGQIKSALSNNGDYDAAVASIARETQLPVVDMQIQRNQAIARKAVSELKKNGAVVWDGQGVGRFALGITPNALRITREGLIDIRGKEIRNPRDLAQVMQAFRHTNEIMHHVAIGDSSGKILAHKAVSSRLPNSTTVFLAKPRQGESSINAWERELYEIKDWLTRVGNTAGETARLVLVHNHPAGTPLPSTADINATNQFSRRLGSRFKYHIVINSGDYSMLLGDEQNKWQVPIRSLDPERKPNPLDVLWSEDTYSQPSQPHPSLRLVTSPEDWAAVFSAAAHSDTNFVTVVAVDSRVRVRAGFYVPRALVNNPDGFAAWARKVGRETGTDTFFASAQNTMPDVYQMLTAAVQKGLLYDAVVVDSKGNALTSLRPILDREFKTHGLALPNRGHLFDSLKGGDRVHMRDDAEERAKALAWLGAKKSWSKKPNYFALLTDEEKYHAVLTRITEGSVPGGVEHLNRLDPANWEKSNKYPKYFGEWRPTPEQLDALKDAFKQRVTLFNQEQRLLESLRKSIAERHGKPPTGPTKRTEKIPLEDFLSFLPEDLDKLMQDEPRVFSELTRQFFGHYDRIEDELKAFGEPTAREQALQQLDTLRDLFHTAAMRYRESGPHPLSEPRSPLSGLNRMLLWGKQNTAAIAAMLRMLNRPMGALGIRKQLPHAIDQQAAIEAGDLDQSVFWPLYQGSLKQHTEFNNLIRDFMPLSSAAAKSEALDRAIFTALELRLDDRELKRPEWNGFKVGGKRINLSEWVPKLRDFYEKAITAAEKSKIDQASLEAAKQHYAIAVLEEELAARELEAAQMKDPRIVDASAIPPRLHSAVKKALRSDDPGNPDAGEFGYLPGALSGSPSLAPVRLGAVPYKTLENRLESAKRRYDEHRKSIEDIKGGVLRREGYITHHFAFVRDKVMQDLRDPYSIAYRYVHPKVRNAYLENERTGAVPYTSWLTSWFLYTHRMLETIHLEPALKRANEKIAQLPDDQRVYAQHWMLRLQGVEMPLDRALNRVQFNAMLDEPGMMDNVFKAVTGKDFKTVVQKGKETGEVSPRGWTSLGEAMGTLAMVSLLSPIRIARLNLTEQAFMLLELSKRPHVDLPMGAVWWLQGLIEGGLDGMAEFASYLGSTVGLNQRYFSEPSKRGVTDALDDIQEHRKEMLQYHGEAESTLSRFTDRVLKLRGSIIRATEFINRAWAFRTLENRNLFYGMSEEDAAVMAAASTNDLWGAYSKRDVSPVATGQLWKQWWRLKRFNAAKSGLTATALQGAGEAVRRGVAKVGGSRFGVVEPSAEAGDQGMLPPPPPPPPPAAGSEYADWPDDEKAQLDYLLTPPTHYGAAFPAGPDASLRHLFSSMIGLPAQIVALFLLGSMVTEKWRRVSAMRVWDNVDPWQWENLAEIPAFFWNRDFVRMTRYQLFGLLFGLTARDQQEIDKAEENLLYRFPIAGQIIMEKKLDQQRALREAEALGIHTNPRQPPMPRMPGTTSGQQLVREGLLQKVTHGIESAFSGVNNEEPAQPAPTEKSPWTE